MQGIFNEELGRLYTAEIVLAITHLHSLGFVHRDLKPVSAEDTTVRQLQHKSWISETTTLVDHNREAIAVPWTPLRACCRAFAVLLSQSVCCLGQDGSNSC